MKTIKVKVIHQFKQLDGILDVGDSIDLNVLPTGYEFKAKNGENYSEQWMYNQIGPISLERIFEKQ